LLGLARNSSGLERLPRCRNIVRGLAVNRYLAKAAQTAGNLEGSYRPQRRSQRGSASTTMHSLATISRKLPNSKAKSENPTLRESQNSDVAQIRNTDHTR
jgi:hypothetical protein